MGLLDFAKKALTYRVEGYKPQSEAMGLLSAALPSPAGDVVGLLADGMGYAENPETLTPGRGLLSLAAMAPGIPRKSDKIADWLKGSKITKPVFHGSSADFDKFDVSKTADGRVWFSSNRKAIEAGEEGASGRGKIYELAVNLKNPAGPDEVDKYFTDQLISMGYDGAILPDGDEFVGYVFDPEKIKIIKKHFGK